MLPPSHLLGEHGFFGAQGFLGAHGLDAAGFFVCSAANPFCTRPTYAVSAASSFGVGFHVRRASVCSMLNRPYQSAVFGRRPGRGVGGGVGAAGEIYRQGRHP